MRKRPKSSNEIALNKSLNAQKLSSAINQGSDPTAKETEIVWGRQEAHLIEEMAGAGMESAPEETANEHHDAHTTGILTTTPKTSTVKRKKKQRLQTWDKMLKAFRYGDALDSVLSSVSYPTTFFEIILRALS
jgi:U3 small nucleolar RNA-associated protein 15